MVSREVEHPEFRKLLKTADGLNKIPLEMKLNQVEVIQILNLFDVVVINSEVLASNGVIIKKMNLQIGCYFGKFLLFSEYCCDQEQAF